MPYGGPGIGPRVHFVLLERMCNKVKAVSQSSAMLSVISQLCMCSAEILFVYKYRISLVMPYNKKQYTKNEALGDFVMKKCRIWSSEV